jgi:BirA family biotin operon repressor/biotin-[acetyl-CoA-carboxylase] ligase
LQHFLDNYPILYYPEVDSTNIVLKQKLKEQNLTAPFAIAAGFQSAGRGQRQNIWQSTANKNVLCSFLVQGLSLNQLPFITNVAVLAIGKTLEAFGISNYQVKWPNDIFVGEKKIAGILIENVIAGTDLKHCVV